MFLAGAECPFTCSFCDLWRWTIDGPTPPGALTAQLREVLSSIDEPRPDRLKLYNASNFFDHRSVPADDLPAIATLATSFSGVTVESHASMIGPRTKIFAQQLSGRLEVAMGLESVHRVALQQLNKRLDLTRFQAAAAFLRENDIDLRVFVLLNAPHVPASESVEWTVRAVEFASRCGASVVSIIPVRGGNGEMERLQSIGEFMPPTLGGLEAALDQSLTFAPTVVTADLWDVQCLAKCHECGPARIERLERINLTGNAEARVTCAACDGR